MGKFERVMPALPEASFEAMKADIAARGVQIPVEVDGNGTIIDGYMRNLACHDLGIKCPTVTLQFGSETEKIDHAIKVNLLRRQAGPLTWAVAFRRLCEIRGVSLGQGARNDCSGSGTSASVAEVATELGVKERTARWRVAAADLLAKHPDLYAAAESDDVDHMSLSAATREAERREERQRAKRLDERDKEIKATSRFARSPLARACRGVGVLPDGGSTAMPLMLAASHTYDVERPDELVRFGVSEYPVPGKGGRETGRVKAREPDFDGGELVYPGSEVPLLSPTDDAVISAAALKLDYDWFPDPAVTQATTRHMSWEGDKLLLPTGHWEGVIYGEIARRWWVWDYIAPREGRLIRKLGNWEVFPLRLLETMRQAGGNDHGWVACEYLEEALEADLAAVREHRAAERSLYNPRDVYEMGVRAAPDKLAATPAWQRFAAYVQAGGQLEAAPLEPRQREVLFDAAAESPAISAA